MPDPATDRPIDQLMTLVLDAIGTTLRIEDRAKHQTRDEYGRELSREEIHPDTRERWAHWDTLERLKLAESARKISELADWGVVEQELAVKAATHHVRARDLYDQRMATKRPAPAVVDVELPFEETADALH